MENILGIGEFRNEILYNLDLTYSFYDENKEMLDLIIGDCFPLYCSGAKLKDISEVIFITLSRVYEQEENV